MSEVDKREDSAEDMEAELREGDGPQEQTPPSKPILSARLSSSPTNVAPATPTLSARLSPTGVDMKGLRSHDERDARGILGMASFRESGSRPQSPLETTKKLLHGLVGVAQGGGGDEAGVGFPWALLESVSSPAAGRVAGAGNTAHCEQRNPVWCPPRGPSGSSRAASPLLAKLKPTGPPKTLCRDLPKRQPRSTKVLETPDALRMKLAIESEVISEHVQGSGDGEGEGEYEGEGSGEGDYKASHRHSAPASMIYNVNLMNCSPWRGAVGGAAGCDHVHIAEEVGRGGRLGGEAERRHSAPADVHQPTSLSDGLPHHHGDNRDCDALLRASCRTPDGAGEAQGHDLR